MMDVLLNIVAWIGLGIGAFLLLTILMALAHLKLPPAISGVLSIAAIIYAVRLSGRYGIGTVLLWVWGGVIAGLLVVLFSGLLHRARVSGQR